MLLSALAGPATQAQAHEEVPFITTPDHVTRVMLEMAGVGEKDYVIDLGSGDGRIVITAAKTFGARGLGVEIDPSLVQRSRDNAVKAGVADRTEFREQDLFKTDLSPATVITMYLLPVVNLQLRPVILALKPGTRIVSHDWDMGDWLPDRTRVVEVPNKTVGLEKFSRLHLWTVPAKVHGRWCGVGVQRGWMLEFQQQYQVAQGRLTAALPSSASPTPPQALLGRLHGADFFADDGLAMRVGAPTQSGQSAELAVTQSAGRWSALAGGRFMSAGASGCPT